MVIITFIDRVSCIPGCLIREQRITLNWCLASISSILELLVEYTSISCAYLLLFEWPWYLDIKVIFNNNVLNLFFISVHSASEETIESKAQEEEPSSLLKYFSVVWCKASKKKHKKWEGDAILIVKGRSFTLKDLEGKDIGRGILPVFMI